MAENSNQHERQEGSSRRGRQGPAAPRAAAFAAGILALALAVWVTSLALRTRSASKVPPEKTLLVLPLEVHGQDEGADFAGRAFAEALAINLAQSTAMNVLPVPEPTAAVRGGALEAVKIAQSLGAGNVMVGSLARAGPSVRVQVTLVATRGNRVLWRSDRGAGAADLAWLAAALASDAKAAIGARPGKVYEFPLYDLGPPAMAKTAEMNEAIGALRRLETAGALDATDRLVARFPGAPEALALRSCALLYASFLKPAASRERRALEKSLDALRKADPASPWPDAFDAVAQGWSGNAQGAMPLYSRVLARQDLSPAARGAILGMRSDLRANAESTSAGIEDLEEAVRLDPANDNSLNVLATALRAAGRYEDAERRARQAAAINPAVADHWTVLGESALCQGKWEEFARALKREVRLDPANEDVVLSRISDGLSSVGRYAEAVDYARRALELKPGQWFYGLQVGLSLIRLGSWQEAVPLLEKACEEGLPVNCGIAEAARAVALSQSGSAAEAEAAAQRALRMKETKSLYYGLACYHALRGDRNEALQFLDLAAGLEWIEPGLETDPNLKALRSDPRFWGAITKMRSLPPWKVIESWGESR